MATATDQYRCKSFVNFGSSISFQNSFFCTRNTAKDSNMEDHNKEQSAIQLQQSLPRVEMQNETKNEFRNLEDCNTCSLSTKKAHIVNMDGKAYSVVKEGRHAELLFPISREVFYNPIQEFNRDISIAVIKAFIEIWKAERDTQSTSSKRNCVIRHKSNPEEEKITLLEAFSASGIRAIRYALEIPGLDHITANDMSAKAVETIQANIKYNKVEHIVEASKEEASLLMYKHRSYSRNQYVIVDLDPFGTAAPFLDAAVQSVVDGGLLMVTCTDLAILCGNASEKCHANYGAMSLRTKCCHEMALRIVLQSIESHANRYGRYIVPSLSLSIDFYVRIFVRIYTSPSKVKETASKLAMVYQCKGCETLTLQPIGRFIKTEKGSKYSPGQGPPVNKLCEHCQHQHAIGGPIWIGPLHNKDFLLPLIQSVAHNEDKYETGKRIFGVLNMVLEELEDCPLFYSIDQLASTLHAQTPKMVAIRSALMNAGYAVSYSHACATSIKTDAPAHVIWDIMRVWVKKNPIKRKLEDGDPAKAILDKEPVIDVCFDEREDATPASLRNRLLRFQMNPEPYWGPKTKPKSIATEGEKDMSRVNQGKRSKVLSSPDHLKQYPCKRFKAGKCERGDNCCYSHELENEANEKNEEQN